jgi:hypothetical protein
VRDPVIVILVLIAFFSAISGKPLDGLLIILVTVALTWDAWVTSRHAPAAPSEDEPAWPHPAALVRNHPAGVRGSLALLAGGSLYAAAAGSFTRFSWPATIAVAGLGALVIFIGWQGPVRPRPVPGRMPLAGVAAWGAVLGAGGLWELWALMQQPSLTATSYAHPTISALTDPLLAAQPGRAAVLAGWLLLGWYLIRR